MSPALRDGDVIICKTVKPAALRCGFIYVINHSDLGRIVKRLGEKQSFGRYSLLGDNPKSTPSSVLGTVEPARITHRALFVIRGWSIKRL